MTTPVVDESISDSGSGEERARRRPVTSVALGVGSAAIVAVIVVAIIFQLSGGRWFIVQTPSMGQAAPVGTLILDRPVAVSTLRVGDIITFHPPTAPVEVYTHRIVTIDSDGVISTRGDANGATDPWSLHQDDLIGEAFSVLPRLGWLVRAIPFLVIGFALVWLLTLLVSTPVWRTASRLLGVCLVVAVTTYILRPFVNVSLLTTTSASHGVTATVISTGILPISVTAVGGTSTHLVSGQTGSVYVPRHLGAPNYSLYSGLNLPWWGWLIFFAMCALPLLWCVLVWIPKERRREQLSLGAKA